MNNQQMMNRPMQGMAEQMATHGRYGDSMLVHMNPVEVQGLASLSPTGELTRNPMTGQPEAFLPFLIPLLGSMGGSAMAGGALATSLGLGSLGATAMGAIGSGLATTAVTGDLKQGVMAGITGYGLGSAMQGASELMNPELVGAAGDLSGATANLQSLKDTALSGTAAEQATNAANRSILGADALSVDPFQTGATANFSPTPNMLTNQSLAPVAGAQATGNTAGIAYKQNVLDGLRKEAGQNVGANMQADPVEFMKNFGKNAMTKGTMYPVALGEGMRGQQIAEDEAEEADRKFKAEKQATLDRSTAVRDAAIDLARQDYSTSSYGGYAGGGLVSLNPNEYARQMNGVQTVGMDGGGPAGMNFNFGGMGGFGAGAGAPAKTQQTLRPPNVVTADQLAKEAAELTAQGKDPRAGFASEINYFRATPEEAGQPAPPDVVIDDPDTGGDPIVYPPMMPGKGGNFNVEDYMTNAGSAKNGSGPANPMTGGRKDERPNFTMGDMAGLMGQGDPSLYDDSAMAEEVTSGKGSAKSAVDSIGIKTPIVPIYNPQPDPITLEPMGVKPEIGRRIMGRKAQMRFAGGQVLNMEGGGIASIDPQNMAMQDPLSMGNEQTPMMQEAEVMQVVSQVAQALSQGITVDQLPPELIEKIKMAVKLFGEEAIMSMISAQSQPQQPPQGQPPQGQPPMPQQGQPPMQPIPNMEMQPPMQPETYNFQEGGATPNPETQLIEQTISAVLGQMPQEQADVVINMFISEYGQEAFELLREQALQSVVPNAQTEGVIRGQGGGMDDMVNGMIGTEQPVAVSPGEYIVPADVVSGLGDGSTDGGVQELDGMLDRVRQTRTGTTSQPAPMRTGGVLPA